MGGRNMWLYWYYIKFVVFSGNPLIFSFINSLLKWCAYLPQVSSYTPCTRKKDSNQYLYHVCAKSISALTMQSDPSIQISKIQKNLHTHNIQNLNHITEKWHYIFNPIKKRFKSLKWDAINRLQIQYAMYHNTIIHGGEALQSFSASCSICNKACHKINSYLLTVLSSWIIITTTATCASTITWVGIRLPHIMI